MAAKGYQGDKDDHRWAIHRRVIQVPQEVISEASEQHPQDGPIEIKTNGQGHVFL